MLFGNPLLGCFHTTGAAATAVANVFGVCNGVTQQCQLNLIAGVPQASMRSLIGRLTGLVNSAVASNPVDRISYTAAVNMAVTIHLR